MSEDKEIQEINQKKLKEKGAKIVEEKQQLTATQVLLNISEYLNTRGLEAMNLSNEIKALIANQGQANLNIINKKDSEKQ